MKRGIFLGLTLWLLLATSGQAEESNSLIILNAKNQFQTEKAIELIESLNGKVRHVFTPDVLIGYLPEGIDRKLKGKAFISEISHNQVSAFLFTKNFLKLSFQKGKLLLESRQNKVLFSGGN